MTDSSWLPVVSTVFGAVIALAGTLLAGVRTDRSHRRRDLENDRLRGYLDFVLALDAAHNALRVVARTDVSVDRYGSALRAVDDASLYPARERLLLSGSADLVKAAEAAFLRLIDIRGVVREGAKLDGPEYHDAYHAFADALWHFRMAARGELGQRALAPAELDRTSWSERPECSVCGQQAVDVRPKGD